MGAQVCSRTAAPKALSDVQKNPWAGLGQDPEIFRARRVLIIGTGRGPGPSKGIDPWHVGSAEMIPSMI